MSTDREAAHQARENVIHAAAIRAALCAARGLPPSSACRVQSWNPPPTHCQACGASPADAERCEHFGVCELPGLTDSEGGEI